MTIERFAPSPTGLLHLGHAYSALMAYDAAKDAGGTFLLRIEDIDTQRCRKEFERAIFADLDWLGIEWPIPVFRQSDRMPAYLRALERLDVMGLTYRCVCSRKDILNALAAPQEGVQSDTVIYPRTCRRRSVDISAPASIRLDMTRALDFLGDVRDLTFDEIGGEQSKTIALDPDYLITNVGDFVLARKDIGTSYHLSVVVDDAEQQITHVTRGEDMQDATPIHRLLQALLDLPTPIYRHHGLIRDEAGKRLAKRADAQSIRQYRANGLSPSDVRALVGL